jgi:hypothetical protein
VAVTKSQHRYEYMFLDPHRFLLDSGCASVLVNFETSTVEVWGTNLFIGASFSFVRQTYQMKQRANRPQFAPTGAKPAVWIQCKGTNEDFTLWSETVTFRLSPKKFAIEIWDASIVKAMLATGEVITLTANPLPKPKLVEEI